MVPDPENPQHGPLYRAALIAGTKADLSSSKYGLEIICKFASLYDPTVSNSATRHSCGSIGLGYICMGPSGVGVNWACMYGLTFSYLPSLEDRTSSPKHFSSGGFLRHLWESWWTWKFSPGLLGPYQKPPTLHPIIVGWYIPSHLSSFLLGSTNRQQNR